MAAFTKILGYALVIISVYMALRGEAAGGAIGVSAGFIFIILGTIQPKDIEEINIFKSGIKLRATLDRAEEIILNLKAIAVPLSEMAITTAALQLKQGQGISRRSLEDLVIRTESALKAMGAKADEIESSKKIFYEVKSFVLAQDIFLNFHEAKSPVISQKCIEMNEEMTKVRQVQGDESEVYRKYGPFTDSTVHFLIKSFLEENATSKNIKSEFNEKLRSYDNYLDETNREMLIEILKPRLDELERFNDTHQLINPHQYLSVEKSPI
ncbi:hypothetical protein [Pantoea rwandensis]|uniref:Uncharacterized protein n=1 Tax=Pantoea rwandensis TaxID=1076550 RepID=A0ABM5RG51_9GAMM|nr:hypothetical protein [Pantoea rwandensis]AIR84894.1 hypothetical protein LH22_05215 [Pantoea rwandensis]